MILSPLLRPARPAAGFTLVEALVAISITALAASVLLLGLQTSLHTTDECLRQTIAAGMAQQTLDAVLGFDDIRARNGIEHHQPPVDLLTGERLGADGKRHPDLFVDNEYMEYFDHWQQEIEVYPVDSTDTTTRKEGGDCRAVEVRIRYYDPDLDPERGWQELAKLRNVVYVGTE